MFWMEVSFVAREWEWWSFSRTIWIRASTRMMPESKSDSVPLCGVLIVYCSREKIICISILWNSSEMDLLCLLLRVTAVIIMIFMTLSKFCSVVSIPIGFLGSINYIFLTSSSYCFCCNGLSHSESSLKRTPGSWMNGNRIGASLRDPLNHHGIIVSGQQMMSVVWWRINKKQEGHKNLIQHIKIYKKEIFRKKQDIQKKGDLEKGFKR